jgi:hypothetical protein
MNETARTILLGVIGLCVAIALSVAALQLTNQQVGITAEPVDAGADLAPSKSQQKRLEPVRSDAERAERESREPRDGGTDAGDDGGSSGGSDDRGGDRGGDDGGGDDEGGDRGGDDDDGGGGDHEDGDGDDD